VPFHGAALYLALYSMSPVLSCRVSSSEITSCLLLAVTLFLNQVTAVSRDVTSVTSASQRGSPPRVPVDPPDRCLSIDSFVLCHGDPHARLRSTSFFPHSPKDTPQLYSAASPATVTLRALWVTTAFKALCVQLTHEEEGQLIDRPLIG